MNEEFKNKKARELSKNSNGYITFLELLAEIIAWFAIVVSLSFFSGIIGGIIYLISSGKLGLIIAIIITGIGVVTSIIYACYVWKTKGTVNFISNSSWKYNNRDNPD